MTRLHPRDVATIANALELPGVLTVVDLARALPEPDLQVAYLIAHVAQRRVPDANDLLTFVREWGARGLGPAVADLPRPMWGQRHWKVRVSSGLVVDITDTASSRFTTGIQRVARETLRRWTATSALEPVVWDRTARRFVAPGSEQLRRAEVRTPDAEGTTVIPFRGRLFLPEIAVDLHRADALRVIADHAGVRAVAVGFDCIPITTAETAGPGMPGAFSRYLAALSRFDIVAPISYAAGDEYAGWARMLAGAGVSGPGIQVVPLPTQSAGVASNPELTRQRLALGFDPVVLSVGSKEPRKNHLNLLHACELVWREGINFTLVLVGGNAWEARRVDDLITSLRSKKRRIVTLSGVDDGTVWDLYRLARLTAFCSVNEGFGLPVVESLSVGTPVMTSAFGSMRQLGEGRGAVLTEPHDPLAIAENLRRMLTDDDLIRELKKKSELLPKSTWDEYAAALWAILVA